VTSNLGEYILKPRTMGERKYLIYESKRKKEKRKEGKKKDNDDNGWVMM